MLQVNPTEGRSYSSSTSGSPGAKRSSLNSSISTTWATYRLCWYLWRSSVILSSLSIWTLIRASLRLRLSSLSSLREHISSV